MDLPMISALCNDHSLLNQTNFVVPQHPQSYNNTKWVKGLHNMFDVKKHSSKIRPSSRHNSNSKSDKHKDNSRTLNTAETSSSSTSTVVNSLVEPKKQQQQTASGKTLVSHQCLQEGKSSLLNQNTLMAEVKKKAKIPSFSLSGKTSYTASSCKKYPVSGLSTNKFTKTAQRKLSSTTHTHPLQYNCKHHSGAGTTMQGPITVKKASQSSVT